MIAKLASVLLLLGLAGLCHGQGQLVSSRTKVRNLFAFIADKGLISPFAHQCIDNSQKFKQEITPSPSIETLIDLIERLEDFVENSNDYAAFHSPDKVARMLLHRFHMDSVDFNTIEQNPYVENAARIDTQIIGRLSGVEDYYFPDDIYTREELCTMLFMFSHIFLNNTADYQLRGVMRRATYQFQRNQANAPTQSGFLPTTTHDNVGPLQEKGIVSFRQDKKEAIAPAKVLMGIIAGMTENAVLSGKTITSKLAEIPMPNEITLKDPILAATFGNLMGTASFFQYTSDIDQNLLFGVQGTWVNETCCTYYATEGVSSARVLRKTNRGSMAQIRGALDGYIIGNNLKKNLQDVKQLRLSNILKSYYSWPHLSSTGNKLGLSYCDRRDNRPSTTELNDIGNSYSQIYNYVFSMDGSQYKGDVLTGIVDRAATPQQEFCNMRPSGGNVDNAPCETPSDLIFVVDPKTEEASKSAQLISELVTRINKIGRYAGAVSVFVNSNTRNNVELPSGSGGWPLPALVWNSTNIGSAVCQLLPETQFVGQNNLGKYLHNVNQTIFNYKWWTRRSYAGVPSKNVILIDYGSLVMPTSGTDKDDYYTYRDALKWRNRDVKYLVVSPKQEFFKDFVREDSDIVNTQGDAATIAKTFADKICKNPATLIYNDCYHKESQNVTYEGYITPGYYQSWAVYPEYFKASSSMEFKIKAVEGSIKYCYDRTYPTVKQEYCKELAEHAEDSFKYWGPCSGNSVHTCSPLYITVWGKDRSTVCKDAQCQSLDQIKFSIGHTGLYCNSAMRLVSAFALQAIAVALVWMYSFKSV